MKTRTSCYAIIALFMVCSLNGQIKIGENPQNLDPSSVLELESDSRVLVITRMTTAQMEGTSPLRGAMVYNTDTECIHFYTGIQWENLCDRPDQQTFTTDAIVNFSPSIVITQDGTNFNFEVGEIRGENIVDTSINGAVDIQQGSITGEQLQASSITYDKLADGETTGDILQWTGAEWTLTDVSTLTVTEVDGVIGNEVVGPADGTLQLSGAGDAGSPYLLDVSVGGINNAELADNAVTTAKILNGEVNTDDIADGAITLPKIADGTSPGQLMQWDGADWVLVDDSALAITEADGIVGNEVTDVTDATLTRSGTGTLADPYTLAVSTNGINTAQVADNAVTLPKLADGTAAGQLMQWDGTDWVLVDDSALTITEADGIVGNEVTDVTDATLTRSGTGTLADPYTLAVSTNGINTAQVADNAVTLPKLADGTAPGQLMQWDGTDWVLVDDSALTITEVDGIVGNEVTNVTDATLTRSGTGTLVDPYTLAVSTNGITTTQLADDAVTLPKIADGTAPGQLMQWDGTDWVLVDDSALTITEADGIVGNEVTDVTDATLTRSGTGTLADPYTLAVSTNGINTAQVADNAVTLPKLADGTAPGQLMQWDGTDWVLVDDSALTITEVDGIVGNEVTNVTDATLTRSGTGTLVDPYTLAVSTNGITTTQLADDAVTLPKIADGTAPGQLMQWDGTDWVLVDDSALTITEVDGIVGNEVTNVTDATLTRSGTGTLVDPYTLAVSTNGITTTQLADDAVTPAKIAAGTNGQVLTTDGAGNTTWQSPYHAIGKMNGATETRGSGINSINNIGTGNYQVIFSSPASTANYVIQLTLLNAGSGISIEVTGQTANGFTVTISDNIGTLVDSEWYFTVIDF